MNNKPNELEITVSKNKDKYLLITLSGNINLNSIDYLSNNIKEIKINNITTKYYIFDIKNLKFISSGGIGIFMDLYNHVESLEGKICFIGIQPTVKRVFDLVGFMQYFGDATSMEEAIEYIKK
jgi:stage II sporulation protein AA (anti-sigma F factor antagonist)